MTDTELLCPDCGATYEVADNYCRQCGMYLAALRTVATVPNDAQALEPVRTGLPAPVKKAATALAVGTALQVAVGLTGKYIARQAARQALTTVKPSRVAKPEPRRPSEPARSPVPVENASEGTTAVSETLIIQRVWMRRSR